MSGAGARLRLRRRPRPGSMLLPLLLAACAAPLRPPGGEIGEELLILAPVKQMRWEGRDLAARATLDAIAWEHTGNLAAERMRQDMRLDAGERIDVVRELDRLAAEHDGADLAYLRARVIEDPVQRLQVFRAQLERWPDHPWLRLGAAATMQQLGEWGAAGDLLSGTAEHPQTVLFARLLIARQLAHRGETTHAFELLEQDAFRDGEAAALYAWAGTGRTGRRSAARRARTHRDLGAPGPLLGSGGESPHRSGDGPPGRRDALVARRRPG